MRASRSSLKQIVGATILLVVAGIIFFPAYLFWNASIQHSTQSLPRCGRAPAFEGKDQSGQTIANGEMLGRIWVADFVQITDRQQGELLSGKFAELDQNFQRSASLALITFSMDSGLDAELEQYAQHHEASARWHFVGASKDNASALLEKWASATAGCRETLPPEKLFVLIDQEGEIRRVYDTGATEVVQNVLIDVGTLLRERAK